MVAVPAMLSSDQYPRDEHNQGRPRKKDALISIEVGEHRLLYALYLSLYRFDARQAKLAETVSAIMANYDKLNAFYDGKNGNVKAVK